MRNHRCRRLLALLAALSLPASVAAAPGDYQILRSFPAPMPSPDGLELVDGMLWITECTSEVLFQVEPMKGAVQRTINLPGAFLDHLAWDGTRLWGNDHHGDYRIHRVDIGSGTLDGGFDVDFRPMGLAFDGSHLWSMEVDQKKMYRMDPATGEVVRTLPAPGGNVCGIGWDGVCLWVSDLTAGKYFQVDPETGEVALELDPPGGLGKLFTGFDWDGEHAWVDDENPEAPTVFLLDIEMKTVGACAHPVASAPGEDPPIDTPPVDEPPASGPGTDDETASAGPPLSGGADVGGGAGRSGATAPGCAVGNAPAGAFFVPGALLLLLWVWRRPTAAQP